MKRGETEGPFHLLTHSASALPAQHPREVGVGGLGPPWEKAREAELKREQQAPRRLDLGTNFPALSSFNAQFSCLDPCHSHCPSVPT